MKPPFNKSFCDTAALMIDSAKSSTTSTLLPFFSGAWADIALVKHLMMAAIKCGNDFEAYYGRACLA